MAVSLAKPDGEPSTSVVLMSGSIRRVSVRPGRLARTVCAIERADGGDILLQFLNADPRAVVAAWVDRATRDGVFAGLYGVR